jgi:polysaccharide biosynthesis/export protein
MTRACLVVMLFVLATRAPTVARTQAPETANYVVGPEDVLTVTVFNETQLSGRFRVENDGQFSYPFLGRVKAGGLTAADVAAQLRAKLAEGYLRNPQVTVEVDQFKSQSVFVMGEVRTPGKYVLSGAVTLIEALAQAGSPTPLAGAEILILHPKTAGPVGAPLLPNAGDADIQRVNLRDIEGGKLSRNVSIRDGDTIFVPKADRFFVLGNVRNPGSYVLEPNMTVLQAVSLAGGASERGSSRRLRVTRTVDGKRMEINVKPTDIVLPGDTITVRQRLL